MKKIGIITMHKVQNYGSALQAYATQTIIENLGYEARLIDYKYPNSYQYKRGYGIFAEDLYLPWQIWYNTKSQRYDSWYHPNARFLCYYLLKVLPKIMINRGVATKTFNLYRHFHKKYFHTTRTFLTNSELRNHTPKFDVYITGSDQVWNPRFAKGDLSYYLNWVTDKPKIAFSASFSQKDLDEELKKKITPFLLQYNAISMREENGVDLVESLTNRKAEWVPDPTLLLSKDDWGMLVKRRIIKEKYILLYMLDYAFDPKPDIFKTAEYYSFKLGVKVIYIGSYKKDNNISNVEYKEGLGPLEFLNLIKNAELVITSSFHGTSFAVNFLKPLIAFVPSKSDDDRQVSLLTKLGIEQVVAKAGVNNNANPYYDTKSVEHKLNELRTKAISWLEKQINIA